MNKRDIIADLLRRKFFVVLFVILIISFFSWYYIFGLSLSMDIAGNMMQNDSLFNFPALISAALMWSVMMIAMMLPSAIPMILVFSSVNQKRNREGRQFVPTWIFLGGYLLIWSAFGIFAAFIQLLLQNAMILSDELKLLNPYISGAVLVAAGIYQFVHVKNVCLSNCQSPLSFTMNNWRDGVKGAIIMGIQHGLYCLGCCWVLMAILFVGGIMNLWLILAIASFILLEKIVPYRKLVSRAGGALLILSGSLYMLRLVI